MGYYVGPGHSKSCRIVAQEVKQKTKQQKVKEKKSDILYQIKSNPIQSNLFNSGNVAHTHTIHTYTKH